MKELPTALAKPAAFLLLAFTLASLLLVGCSQAGEEPTQDATFSYSDSIDNNGYWEGITATDYVELPSDYDKIEIPKDTHTISDELVQSEIDTILLNYSTTNQITDRAVVDGDTLNIDYVGSVDGVEFESGTTNGAGAEVTIGTTNYVDGFLEQLVGHMPGETVNVEVTFPEDYGNEELNGKNALFVTTINYISEEVQPELTDEFVATNLNSEHGWTTIDEMKQGVRDDLQKSAIQSYIDTYISENSTVSSVPEKLTAYQESGMVKYYQDYADYYEMELDEFLSTYLDVTSVEELVSSNAESLNNTASYTLIIQAIAEKQNIVPSDDDVAHYFAEYLGTDDYSSYEEQYGMSYLKQIVLTQMALDFLTENAKLA